MKFQIKSLDIEKVKCDLEKVATPHTSDIEVKNVRISVPWQEHQGSKVIVQQESDRFIFFLSGYTLTNFKAEIFLTESVVVEIKLSKLSKIFLWLVYGLIAPIMLLLLADANLMVFLTVISIAHMAFLTREQTLFKKYVVDYLSD